MNAHRMRTHADSSTAPPHDDRSGCERPRAWLIRKGARALLADSTDTAHKGRHQRHLALASTRSLVPPGRPAPAGSCCGRHGRLSQ